MPHLKVAAEQIKGKMQSRADLCKLLAIRGRDAKKNFLNSPDAKLAPQKLATNLFFSTAIMGLIWLAKFHVGNNFNWRGISAHIHCSLKHY